MSQAWNSWYEGHLESKRQRPDEKLLKEAAAVAAAAAAAAEKRLKHLTSRALRMWRNRVSAYAI
jgi:mevalonate pyrophosphate decarboxylase